MVPMEGGGWGAGVGVGVGVSNMGLAPRAPLENPQAKPSQAECSA